MRRLVEDLHEGVAGGRVHGVVDVGECEQRGQDHGEAEGAVEGEAGEDGSGDHDGRVADFFGHLHSSARYPETAIDAMGDGAYVNGGIGAHKRKHAADDADEERQTLRLPMAAVDKGREDKLGRVMITHVDEWDQHCEEAQQVDDEDDALELGQQAADSNVDHDAERDDGPDD